MCGFAREYAAPPSLFIFFSPFFLVSRLVKDLNVALAECTNLAAALAHFFFLIVLLLIVVAVAAVLVSWACFLAILVELRGPSALIFATLSLALGLLVHRNNF